MKQVLQHARTGEIAVREVPAPALVSGCVLVRVAASVVSPGTERASAEFSRKSLLRKAQSRPDLVREVIHKVQRDGIFSAVQAVRSRLDQPQSVGYSSAGTVVSVAEGVTGLQPGDRVACAGAGYAVHAELECVPRLLVARIPVTEAGNAVPFEEAAFATLGAVALHGIRTAEAGLGDLVAVIGLGLLGQLTLQLLKAAGCRVVGMDINPARAELALALGAEAVAKSSKEFRETCLEVSRGHGADTVLITAETPGSAPVNLAGAIARDRAIVVAVGTVGMEIERKSFYEKELDFRLSRSYGPGRYDAAFEQKGRDYPIGYVRWTETRNMEAFLDLLASRRISVASLITHRFPIEDAGRAYELITGKTPGSSLGVIIEYSGDVALRDESQGPTLALVSSGIERSAGRVAVGLLGAGVFANSTLLPALNASPSTDLVGICAATGAHAQHTAEKFKFGYATTDETRLIRDPSINTVVVATRHYLHASQVLAAMAAGKNVFCEKPLCLTEEELASIIRGCRLIGATNRVVLTVGFNRRFAPMVARMKSFLGPVFEPLTLHYRINAAPLPADHWLNDPEQGGGRLRGEACHFIDLLMFLAGSFIVEVSARHVGDDARYTGGNVLISLRFANGSEGTVHYLSSGDRAFSKERLEIIGGGSIAVLDDFRRLDLVRDGRREVVRSRWRQDKGHQAAWAAFADSIQRGESSPIGLEEIVTSTLATLRAAESAASGEPRGVDATSFIETALRKSASGPSPNSL
jgi:predicted dehydrogenase/threonine dehydrogenase-like Zn-dependent dehydrogenase